MVLMGVVGAVKCVLDDFWQGLRQRRRRYATPCLILLLAVRWLVWCFLCEVLIIYIYSMLYILTIIRDWKILEW